MRYRIYTWGHDKQDWCCAAHGMRLMRLRYWLRRLRRLYGDCSILVSAEGLP